MRLIPGKTKVKIEIFKSITLADVIVGLVGLVAVTLCSISSLPGRWIIAGIVAAVFVMLLFRLEDEPFYVFVWHMLRYQAYPRRFSRIYTDEQLVQMSSGDRKESLDAFFGPDESKETAAENPEEESQNDEDSFEDMEEADELDKKAKKAEKARLKAILKEENKILKSKTATKEEKDAVWLARAERSAERRKNRNLDKEENAHFEEINDFMPFTAIKDGYIEYNGEYYGAAIEVDPIEFRFFSQYRRDNSIENCFGKILRGISGKYGANIVKIQRPIIYDEYLDAEYDKLDALKASYESGLLSEEELQARVEIQYDRINAVRSLCDDEKVIDPFYYIVLFDSDKRRLDIMVKQALNSLKEGELTVRRLDTKELAVFLKYTNALDFDEKQVDSIAEEQLATWAMPNSLKFTMRTIEVNDLITHNLRVISFPSIVGDSWLAGVMSFPSTKVVVKCTPMDRTKAIRAIDRSLAELRGQYMNTNVDSKIIELQEHIDTLSTLLVTLQQDNENLMSVNIYITAYDALVTSENPILGENFSSEMPYISDMKKTLRRSWSEAGMRLSGMDFLQIQSFIGSQVSAYDPMIRESRGIPTNTIAATFPWIFAHVADVGGIKLGESDGVPVFIDFFRRDAERVNSNMVIVGKSGSGKSYATKSLLTNLASEDAKIFILDPENEYSELAHTLHGKIINVGNAKYGRLNPFHIITALDDDEAAEDGGPSGSFATHLQFLEEFFRQILPDIDKDALEYLNSLVERMYLNFGITPETDLSDFKAGDYPIFDDLYDVILAEFERTNNDYLRQLLRSLVNYISKFSTGGRNANIWNGPSSITTDENFSVFNFQSMLANRNTTIANAQMLLVLKYIDNEIIKNRDYNLKYGLNRKIVVVIDEAHVFIDTKFPVALDFMFQLAKRIRKYNGMQIVITQNIKDFVGSEEIARKSTAIINACQYSFVFGLAPNDMDDLCKLYEKAGGINEREQEDILNAKRGEAFTIMGPTSRSSFKIDVPDSFVDMFENSDFESNYFFGEEGYYVWEEFVENSRDEHDKNFSERKQLENSGSERQEFGSTLTFAEITEDEAAELAAGNAASDEEDGEAGKKSAIDKMLEAEETVNRKEYEMAVGRFGSINLQEMSDDELEAELRKAAAAPDKREMENAAEEENQYSGAEDEAYTAAPAGQTVAPAVSSPAAQAVAQSYGSEPVYSQKYIDEELERFKQSLREEMSRELEEKIKWISLGAGLANASMAAAPAVAPAVETTAERPARPKKAAAAAARKTATKVAYAPEDVDTDYDEDEYDDELYGDSDDSTRDYKPVDLDNSYDDTDDYSMDDDYSADEKYTDDDSLYDDDFESDDEDYTSGDDDYTSDDEDEDYTSGDDDYSLDDEDEDYTSGDDDYESDDDEDFESDDDEDEIDFNFDSEDDDEDSDLNFDADEEDDFDFNSDDDDLDSLFDDDDDESEEYEPAPFLFAELLAEAAEEYANMDIEERMDEMGEDVIEITVEELANYIKQQRKKK